MAVAAGLLFVLFRWNDLSLPYFWDEQAGYMSGILYMADNGISLHPSAIPPQMSYGHPLLLHACMAAAQSLFGPGIAVMHGVTLMFTLILGWFVYKLAAHFAGDDKIMPAFAVTWFFFQPVVVAQSTQVLLEMFLTMHTVISLYFYINRKYTLSVLFCAAGIMTKETGLVLALAYPAHIVLKMITGQESRVQLFRRLMVFSIPLACFLAFLIIQKQTHGWYLNPVNVGKSKLDLISMIQKIWDYPLEFTFINQGRYAATLILILSGLLYLMRKKIVLPEINPGVLPVLIFCLGFIAFSSVADTLERYFLMLLPFAAILFAKAMRYLEHAYRRSSYLALIVCLGFTFLYMDNGKRYSEADLSYRHLVKTNQALFDYLNSGQFSNDTIAFAFPLQYAPLDARYGYFKTRRFHADTASRPETKYWVYTSPGNADWNPPDTNRLELVREFHSEWSMAFLYKKK